MRSEIRRRRIISALEVGFGGAADTAFPVDYSRFGSNLVLWASPSVLSTMYVENNVTTVPVTPVTATADKIGFMYTLGPMAAKFSAVSDATRPALGSRSGRSCYEFSGANSERLRLTNTKDYLSPFISATPTWTIAFWVNSDNDGLNQTIIDSNNASFANGVHVKIVGTTLRLIFGSGGSTQVINYTSPSGWITTAMGWIPVIITANGAGVGAGTVYVGANTATFNILAGAAGNSSTDLFMGSRAQTNDQTMDGGIGDIIVTNNVWSAGDRTWFYAWNPSRITTEFPAILDIDLDYNDVTKMFQEAAGTTPVAANNDPIGRINPSLPATPFGSYNKQWTGTNRPLYKTNQINGLGVGEWDGVDDNLTAQGGEWPRGAKWTAFVIGKNFDATFGSHYLYDSTYLVETGANYINNPIPGQPYFVWHHSAGSLNNAQADYPVISGFNITGAFRNGGQMGPFTQSTIGAAVSMPDACYYSQMGREYVANFWLNGQVARLIMYSGIMTNAQITAKINELKTTYGIS